MKGTVMNLEKNLRDISDSLMIAKGNLYKLQTIGEPPYKKDQRLYLVSLKDSDWLIHTELFTEKEKAEKRFESIVRWMDCDDELPNKLENIKQFEWSDIRLYCWMWAKCDKKEYTYRQYKRAYNEDYTEVLLDYINIDEENKVITELLNPDEE